MIKSVHIDWYQFRVGFGLDIGGMGRIAQMRVRLAEMIGTMPILTIWDLDYEISSGHKLRFAHRLVFKESGANIYFGSQDYFLVVLPATACHLLRSKLCLHDVIQRTKGVVSRVDIAIDIETDEAPVDVAKEGMDARQTSVLNAATGQTVYLGSRKSDAMARIYRYAKPHPRSDTVRVEYEFKRGLAGSVANAIVAHNVRETASAACERFSLHTLSKMLPATVASITAPPRGTRDDQGTVIWLQTQVAPAVKRLIAEGVLTVDEAINILLPDDFHVADK